MNTETTLHVTPHTESALLGEGEVLQGRVAVERVVLQVERLRRCCGTIEVFLWRRLHEK